MGEQTSTIQQGGYAMSKDTVVEAPNPKEGTRDVLTHLLRDGAKRLIAEAVDAEPSVCRTSKVDPMVRTVLRVS